MEQIKGFIAFLKGRGVLWIGVLVLCAGILLAVLPRSEGAVKTSSPESDLASLCSSVEGVGECTVSVTLDTEGRVYAVAVICEGGDRTDVRYRLTEMLVSLYGIGSNRITVEKMK